MSFFQGVIILMEFFGIFVIALGLSMDAFAVAVCIGLSFKTFSIEKAFVVGLYFGLFQAIMPLIGYIAANQFAERIMQFGNWIAFGLLVILGGRMIWGSFKKDGEEQEVASLKFFKMLPLALATSVDALAVGVSFAFLYVHIIPAVIIIGATTFALSAIGVKVGSIFGLKFKAKAEFAGGVILVLMGLRVLIGG